MDRTVVILYRFMFPYVDRKILFKNVMPLKLVKIKLIDDKKLFWYKVSVN